jgi:GT2 family glycosyltransferase
MYSMAKVLPFTRHRQGGMVDPQATVRAFVGRDESRALQGGAIETRRRPRPASSGGTHDGADVSAAELMISVVVPTRGRPRLLNRCLASLVLQRFDRARFEIIIVDDRPNEDTRQVVARWVEHTGGAPLVSYIPSFGPHGPAAARNIGWRAARGDVVAFTDDDTIAGSAWLEHGLRCFDDRVHAAWGRVVRPLPGTPTDCRRDAGSLGKADFVTANCFCRRQVLEAIGGFDERFRDAWREGADLYFRLLDYPAKIVHVPKAVVTHPIRPAAWGSSLAQMRKLQFDALLFKKHPARYRESIRATPRWDYYLAVAALLAFFACAALRSPVAAAVFGTAWLSLTARFCWQRLRHTSRAPSHVAEMVVTSMLIPPLAVTFRAVGALRFRVRFL